MISQLLKSSDILLACFSWYQRFFHVHFQSQESWSEAELSGNNTNESIPDSVGSLYQNGKSLKTSKSFRSTCLSSVSQSSSSSSSPHLSTSSIISEDKIGKKIERKKSNKNKHKAIVFDLDDPNCKRIKRTIYNDTFNAANKSSLKMSNVSHTNPFLNIY